MSVSVNLKSYFYEVLIPSSQKNTSSPIEDILHHVSKYIFYEKACALQMFQSTHPHGVRPLSCAALRHRKLVSIHAPTRGATTSTPLALAFVTFQSTHPHGVRPLADFIGLGMLMFQSTHPHGVRLVRTAMGSIDVEFQSTHPHGVRHHE